MDLMQNTNVENNINNNNNNNDNNTNDIDTKDLPNDIKSASTLTTIASNTNTDTTNSTARYRPFSFASSYTSSVFSPLQNNNNYLPTKNILENSNTQAIKSTTAFTVLNNEDFYIYNSKPKPNQAIVRPIPRKTEPQNEEAGDTHFSDISADTNAASLSSVAQTELPSNPRERHNFTEELNRKLHYLRSRDLFKDCKPKNYSKHGGKRPLFITTVPTGVFLPSAQKYPLPIYNKRHVYAYSSHPVIFNEVKYTNNISSNIVKKSTKDNLFMATSQIALDDKHTSVTNSITTMTTTTTTTATTKITTTRTTATASRINNGIRSNIPVPTIAHVAQIDVGLHMTNKLQQQKQQPMHISRNKR